MTLIDFAAERAIRPPSARDNHPAGRNQVGGVVPTAHVTRLVTPDARLGGCQAVCTCGWSGPVRTGRCNNGAANSDGSDHEAEHR